MSKFPNRNWVVKYSSFGREYSYAWLEDEETARKVRDKLINKFNKRAYIMKGPDFDL